MPELPQVKQLFTPVFTLSQGIDKTYSSLGRVYVKLSEKPASEIQGQMEAISASGWVVGMAHPNLPTTQGVVCESIDALAMQDKCYQVVSHWGVPTDPVLDGPWVMEATSESSREERSLDRDGEKIEIKFKPPGQPDTPAFWASVTGQASQRMVSVPSFQTLIHVIARRHISNESNLTFGGVTVAKWPALLSNHVNCSFLAGANSSKITVNETTGKITVTFGERTIPAGVWLCRSVNVSTRNSGQTWQVAVSLSYRSWGWEDIKLFTRQVFGTVSTLVNIPDGMKTAWPTVRESDESPYGAVRPKMLGLMDFDQSPFDLNLEVFTP